MKVDDRPNDKSSSEYKSYRVRKFWLCLVLAGIAVSVSCRVPRQSSTTKDNAVDTEYEEIAESVFRYQLEELPRLKNRQLYFLSLGGDKDPTDEFMKRFIGFTYPVKRYSESIYQNGLVTDKTTGQRGIRLNVKSIKWLGSRETDVEGSWFAGYDDFLEQKFYVNKENGVWSIKSVKDGLVP